MPTEIKIYYGSFASSAGGFFKQMQIVDMPSLEDMEKSVNEFLAKTDIEVINVSHQMEEAVISVMIHYRKK